MKDFELKHVYIKLFSNSTAFSRVIDRPVQLATPFKCISLIKRPLTPSKTSLNYCVDGRNSSHQLNIVMNTSFCK